MGKTILIVDDSASMRQVVSMALKGSDYEVIEAVDGKDALAKLDGQKIHLVISDVNMPNMDGITFVTEMKKLAAYKFVPVVMLTTEGDEQKKKAGDELFQMISEHFAAIYQQRTLALSLEIVEFSEAGTWKQNNIHARYKKA